ncbi:hypothetical protein [Chryseobacterium sp. HSC-36S06]|uniref:hypothetical protein n=1 Tax=Chryseobacterium sp. HSC-36S06 TaxID=2910970 RepID=UPI0020A114BD|nr:hypothetical protein [Chryseobacterium sp. HSC-36S06]MCP2037955.1 hypothetical protein [Chryseobacterium sp. HSC-36S06]
MKNLYLYMLMITSMLTAQVGINTRTPHPSASLDIRSSNKGVSFPKVFLQGRNDITAVPNPKESLIIYNTNGSVGGKEGFYYWDGTKWEYLFTDINQENLMNQMKYYSSNSSTAFTFTRNSPNQFLSYSAHTSGETLNTSQWTVIPALTKSIVIDRPQNDLLLNINGMYQANNGAANNTGGITSTIGFFVDDQLIDVKPLYLDFQSPCSYRQFMIYGIANNLTPGNHTVKFAIRNISAPNISGLTVTYGGPNASCSSLSGFEAAMSSTITINQPYTF